MDAARALSKRLLPQPAPPSNTCRPLQKTPPPQVAGQIHHADLRARPRHADRADRLAAQRALGAENMLHTAPQPRAGAVAPPLPRAQRLARPGLAPRPAPIAPPPAASPPPPASGCPPTPRRPCCPGRAATRTAASRGRWRLRLGSGGSTCGGCRRRCGSCGRSCACRAGSSSARQCPSSRAGCPSTLGAHRPA